MEAFNLKFVGEVEKYQELYNYTLEAYSKRDVTEIAWNKIAEEVNLSVNECKEKWRNLRTTFGRNLKPKPSGSGTSKKKPYYLMEAMQFAVPFMKIVGNPTGNLEAPSRKISSLILTADVDEINKIYEDNQDFENQEISIISPSAPALNSTPSSTNQGETRIQTRGPHGQPIRKRKFTQSDAADKAFAEYISAKQAKLSNPLPRTVEDRREEGIKNFLMSLIPDLMQMNDAQLRSYKRRALLLIDEVSDNSPNN